MGSDTEGGDGCLHSSVLSVVEGEVNSMMAKLNKAELRRDGPCVGFLRDCIAGLNSQTDLVGYGDLSPNWI